MTARGDKTGRPYLEHCERVADAVDTLDEKIVSYLHDVIEKSGWTRGRLEAEGFSPAIVSAVDALTRREEEDDRSFVRPQPPTAWRGRSSGRTLRTIFDRRRPLACGKPSIEKAFRIFDKEFGELYVLINADGRIQLLEHVGRTNAAPLIIFVVRSLKPSRNPPP